MTVVVVTGVSRGLGRAMVGKLVESGCTVCGCARSAAAIEALVSEFGSPHQFHRVDVADDGAVAAWAADVIGEHGAPDFLINNGAIINRNAALWNITAEEFDQLTAVNINGTANTIRHFVPAMVDRKCGTIVNFSSGWGRSVPCRNRR